jgi:hypothetical protein
MDESPEVPSRTCRTCGSVFPDDDAHFRRKKGGHRGAVVSVVRDCRPCELDLRADLYVAPDPEMPFAVEPIWDQQLPQESDRAFGGFVEYRTRPPFDRSAVAVASRLGIGPFMPRAWMKRWRWRQRAAAYDAWVDAKRRHDEAEAIAKLNRDHERLAAQMFRVAARRIVGDPDDPNNKVVPLDPNELGAFHVAKLVEVSSKLGRMALGLSDSAMTARVVGPGGGPLQVEHQGLPEPVKTTAEHMAEVIAVLLESGGVTPEQLGLAGHVEAPTKAGRNGNGRRNGG